MDYGQIAQALGISEDQLMSVLGGQQKPQQTFTHGAMGPARGMMPSNIGGHFSSTAGGKKRSAPPSSFQEWMMKKMFEERMGQQKEYESSQDELRKWANDLKRDSIKQARQEIKDGMYFPPEGVSDTEAVNIRAGEIFNDLKNQLVPPTVKEPVRQRQQEEESTAPAEGFPGGIGGKITIEEGPRPGIDYAEGDEEAKAKFGQKGEEYYIPKEYGEGRIKRVPKGKGEGGEVIYDVYVKRTYDDDWAPKGEMTGDDPKTFNKIVDDTEIPAYEPSPGGELPTEKKPEEKPEEKPKKKSKKKDSLTSSVGPVDLWGPHDYGREGMGWQKVLDALKGVGKGYLDYAKARSQGLRPPQEEPVDRDDIFGGGIPGGGAGGGFDSGTGMLPPSENQDDRLSALFSILSETMGEEKANSLMNTLLQKGGMGY